jgi:exodeoxyribonuclease VIII
MNHNDVGLFPDIPNGEYHGGRGISKSGLDLIARSPLHYKFARDSANDNRPTPAQRIGTAAHDLILEPAEFWNRYAIPLDPADFPDAVHSRDALVEMVDVLNLDRLPKLSASGSKQELADRIHDVEPARYAIDVLNDMKVGDLKAIIGDLNADRHGLLSTRGTQKELAQILADHGQPVELWSDLVAMNAATNDGKEIITADEYAQLQGMRDAVMAHPAAAGLLTSVPGRAEVSAYWNDPITGALCRCRPDFWRADGILVDLKTTDDASPDAFAKSLYNWRYHVQHPFYIDGCRQAIEQGGTGGLDLPQPTHFLFIVVEKKAPHAVAVYKLDQETVELGAREYRRDLATYADCLAADSWPAFGETIRPIGVPEWVLRTEGFGE